MGSNVRHKRSYIKTGSIVPKVPSEEELVRREKLRKEAA
jgi:hypothetical protein